jgi:hypothetical protein
MMLPKIWGCLHSTYIPHAHFPTPASHVSRTWWNIEYLHQFFILRNALSYFRSLCTRFVIQNPTLNVLILSLSIIPRTQGFVDTTFTKANLYSNYLKLHGNRYGSDRCFQKLGPRYRKIACIKLYTHTHTYIVKRNLEPKT